jgi:hypothetical protein
MGEYRCSRSIFFSATVLADRAFVLSDLIVHFRAGGEAASFEAALAGPDDFPERSG